MPKSIVLLCVAVLLSACGQTGALYLPDKGPPKRHPKSPPVKVVAPGASDKAETQNTAPATTTPDAATPAEPATKPDDSNAPAPAPAQ